MSDRRDFNDNDDFYRRHDAEDNAIGFGKIRCPRCRWQPTAASRWYCTDCDQPEYFYGGCDTCWNTFETGGKCPGCGHQWRWTSCLACHEFSRHEDWYPKENA